MGASFAKAVMPRAPKRREAASESDWGLGWIFPVHDDPIRGEVDPPPAMHLQEEEASPEDRS
jgi:hypothetical protein